MCRKNHFLFVLLFLLVIASAPLFAQDLYVEYSAGYVDLLRDGEWSELYIGDYLYTDDTIRLEAGCVVEIGGAGSKITLMREGTYRVSSLLASVATQKQAGVGSLLSGKMKSMFGRQEQQTQSTVGGVRAAEAASDEGDLQWIEGEVEEYIDEGIRSLESEEYEAALVSFQDAYDYAIDPMEENKALFYIGYTNAMMGQTDKALNSLSGLDVSTEAEIYYDYYFVTGKLLLDTFAYRDAAELLSTFNDLYADEEQKQVISFLSGVAYQGAGNNDRAKEYLEKVISINADTDIAKTAKSLHEQLQ